MRSKISTLFIAIVAAVTAWSLPASAGAADWVRIVSISPASGEFQPWVSGHVFDSTNSFEVKLDYNLESLPSAVVAANIVVPHSGVYQVPAARTRGRGSLKIKVSMQCLSGDPAVLSGLRLRAFIAQPVGVYHAQAEQAIPHKFRCRKEPMLKVPTPIVTPGIKPGVKINPDVLKPANGCPDPAFDSLRPRLVRRSTRYRSRGEIQIVGTIRNRGSAPFDTSAGQQEVQLWERTPGARPVMVKRDRFEDLAPGATHTIHYERKWDTSIEFPPDYQLRIVYDPDILKDGNTKNDDCNNSNNKGELRGAQINAIF